MTRRETGSAPDVAAHPPHPSAHPSLRVEPVGRLYGLFEAKVSRPSVRFTTWLTVPTVALAVARYHDRGNELIPTLVVILGASAAIEFVAKWIARRIRLRGARTQALRLVAIVRATLSTLELEPDATQWSADDLLGFHRAIDLEARRDRFLYGVLISTNGNNQLEEEYVESVLACIRETYSRREVQQA